MREMKYILTILLIITSGAAFAQGGLAAAEPVCDLGEIREADGPVTHRFTVRNASDKPVAIVRVGISCGCLTPRFSREPILPGRETAVEITYDPTNRPGTFTKQVGVFSSAGGDALLLVLRGTVKERERSVEEIYPLDLGGGLRAADVTARFAYLYHDGTFHTSVGIVNTSKKTLTLDFVPELRSGFLTVKLPGRLAPGERAEVALSYCVPGSSGRYGTVQDRLWLRASGVKARLPISASGVAVDPEEGIYAMEKPFSAVDCTTIRFGDVVRGAKVEPLVFTLSNNGTAPLRIRAVENGNGLASCDLRAGDEVPAGEKRQVKVRIDTGGRDYGAAVDYLTVVTNDPHHPMRKVRVTAIFRDDSK